MNRCQPEQTPWETELNEHVNYLPPYITAEYRSPGEMAGETPVRLRPAGDESGYGFEVSAPDALGDVTLSATKTFYDQGHQQAMTESVPLKTYQAYRNHGLDEVFGESDPRMTALHDARGLIFEWGKQDLDGAMGSAFKLAQTNGHTGTTLFEQGPPDPFTLAADARDLTAIQAERERERDEELRQSLRADLGGSLPKQQVALRALPIHQPSGETLGHAVVAVDMAWSSEETSLTDWGQAEMGALHELAHFEQADEAQDYLTALNFYLDEHQLPRSGDVFEVAPTSLLMESMSKWQGFETYSTYLEPPALANLQAGHGKVEHSPAQFNPFVLDDLRPSRDMEL